MGGAVSSGRDNNELIDNLMGGGYIRTRSVERVFRVLDRADYMTPTERDQAYKDLAWRSGALHLSAPCIYSEVMEALELKPGLSFLNLGSGTGYLSTLVGLIIGSGGISHGVEIHPGVVEYSTKKLSQFQENSVTLDEFDFCIPKYYCGNALCLAPLQTQYDRVYVGAGVLPKYDNYFKELIKVNGVLVMPLGDTLVQIKRVSESEYTSRQLLNVSFALLRAPTLEESAEPIKLDELVPVSLMLLCRSSIRRAMLAGVCRRHPELKEPAPRRPPAPRPRPRRICIPLDPDTDDPSMNELHDMEGHDGGREMNALLSLVLSMGNNRVAGSLRFGDDLERTSGGDEELEVLINGIDHGSESSSSESDYSTRAVIDEPAARPSAAGAINLHPAVSGAIVTPTGTGTLGDGRGVAPVPGEAAPGTMASGTDLASFNPAGRIEMDDAELTDTPKPTTAPDLPDHGDCSSSDDSKPSTSGKSPGAALSTKEANETPRAGPSSGPSSGSGGSGTKRGGGGGGGGRGSDGGEGEGGARVRRGRGRETPAQRRRNKRFPPEVQIYFGNAGVYAGSDVVQQEVEEAEAAGSEDVNMDGDTSSSDDEPQTSPKDKKRQKLDSGIGEGTASSSTSSTPRSNSNSNSHSHDESYTDASATDNQETSARRAPRRRAVVQSDSGSEGYARRARRNTRDARRVRLSIVMKRAIKELPLPYALKKYVNLHRCFEF